MAQAIEWTPEALRSLHVVFDYVAQDSSRQAALAVERIIARTGQIAVFPLSGRSVPEQVIEGLREVFWKDYRILYRPEKGRIVIMAVVHGSRVLESSFFDE